MEKTAARIKPLNTNSQPESSNNGNKAILIAFKSIFLRKAIFTPFDRLFQIIA